MAKNTSKISSFGKNSTYNGPVMGEAQRRALAHKQEAQALEQTLNGTTNYFGAITTAPRTEIVRKDIPDFSSLNTAADHFDLIDPAYAGLTRDGLLAALDVDSRSGDKRTKARADRTLGLMRYAASNKAAFEVNPVASFQVMNGEGVVRIEPVQIYGGRCAGEVEEIEATLGTVKAYARAVALAQVAKWTWNPNKIEIPGVRHNRWLNAPSFTLICNTKTLVLYGDGGLAEMPKADPKFVDAQAQPNWRPRNSVAGKVLGSLCPAAVNAPNIKTPVFVADGNENQRRAMLYFAHQLVRAQVELACGYMPYDSRRVLDLYGFTPEDTDEAEPTHGLNENSLVVSL